MSVYDWHAWVQTVSKEHVARASTQPVLTDYLLALLGTLWCFALVLGSVAAGTSDSQVLKRSARVSSSEAGAPDLTRAPPRTQAGTRYGTAFCTASASLGRSWASTGSRDASLSTDRAQSSLRQRAQTAGARGRALPSQPSGEVHTEQVLPALPFAATQSTSTGGETSGRAGHWTSQGEVLL